MERILTYCNYFFLSFTNSRLECTKHGHWGFPLWALILTKISHLLLVINSSINCLIYGLISPKFRKTAYWKAKKWGCLVSAIFTKKKAANKEI